MSELGMGLVFYLKDEFSNSADGIKSSLAGIAGAATEMEQKVNQALSNMAVGAAAIGAGLALAAPIGASIKSAEAFEAQLADLSAITGISGAGLDDLGLRAQSLASTFGGKATDYVDSFKTILSRLGPDIAKSPVALEGMANSVATLSKTMGGDAKGAVNALTTAMLQYDVALDDPVKASEEMVRMMNTMAAGAQAGSAEVPQVAESLKVAGLAAKSANLSFEEFNAAVQVMGKGTVYGSEAGTALRNVLGKLGEGRFLPKDATEGLTAAGVNIQKLSDTTLPFSERIRELAKIQDDAALVSKVFGVENKNAAMLLMKNIDDLDPRLEGFAKQVTGTSTATEQAAIIMNTYAEAQKRMEANVENAKTAIGSAFLPTLTSLTDMLGGVVAAAAKFAQTPLGKSFVILAGILGIALIALGSWIVMTNLAKVASLKAAMAFETMGMAQVSTAFATGNLTAGLKALAMTAKAALMPMLPYIVVGLAIYGVYKLVTSAMDAFSEVLSGTAKPATGFLGFLQKVGGLIGAVREALSSWNGEFFDLSDEMMKALDKMGIKDFALNLITYFIRAKEFVEAFGRGVAHTFKVVWNVIQTVWNAISSAIQAVFAPLNKFEGGISKATTTIEDMRVAGARFGNIIAGVLVVAVVLLTVKMFMLAAAVLASTWPILLILGIIALVVAAIANWGSIVDWFADLFQSAWEAIGNFFSGIVDWLVGVWESFVSFFLQAGQSILEYFLGFPLKFLEVGVMLVDKIKEGFISAWENFKQFVSDAVNSINPFADEATVKSTVENVVKSQDMQKLQDNVAKQKSLMASPDVNVAAPLVNNNIEQAPIVLTLDGDVLFKSYKEREERSDNRR
jgi:TP901 family phage tail tape measure protein